jgi:hypothetical protein
MFTGTWCSTQHAGRTPRRAGMNGKTLSLATPGRLRWRDASQIPAT